MIIEMVQSARQYTDLFIGNNGTAFVENAQLIPRPLLNRIIWHKNEVTIFLLMEALINRQVEVILVKTGFVKGRVSYLSKEIVLLQKRIADRE